MADIPIGVVLAGSIEPIQSGLNISLNRINGLTVEVRYRGLASQVLLKFNALKGGAGVLDARYNQSHESPLAEAVIIYDTPQPTAPEESQDSLELNWIESNRSIFLNPMQNQNQIGGPFSGISFDRVQAIQRVVAYSKESGSTTALVDGKAFTDEDISQDGTDVERRALNLLLRNEPDYIAYIPVLSFNRIVSPTFPTNLVTSTSNKVWAQAAVLAYLNIEALLFSIPEVVQSTGVGAPEDHTLGWLKTSSLTFLANGKCQMREQFVYGAYSDFSYTFLSTLP